MQISEELWATLISIPYSIAAPITTPIIRPFGLSLLWGCDKLVTMI
jgi:hypothetical protein